MESECNQDQAKSKENRISQRESEVIKQRECEVKKQEEQTEQKIEGTCEEASPDKFKEFLLNPMLDIFEFMNLTRKDSSQNILAANLIHERKFINLIIDLPLSELDDNNFYNKKLEEGFEILKNSNQ